MAGLSARLTAGLLVCSGVLAVAACQATAVPSPYTPSPEPSRAAAASVVPSVAASTPASVAPTRTVSPAVAKPATTAPARASKPSASSSLGPLRLSYRGITKLVVVKSVLNDTPAGRAAIDAVARYNGALATATQDRTVEPARREASVSCKQCQSDINRIAGFIELHELVVPVHGLPRAWRSVALFIESISPSGLVTVDFDGQQPGVRLIRSNGTIVATKLSTTSTSDTVVLQFDGRRALLIDDHPRP